MNAREREPPHTKVPTDIYVRAVAAYSDATEAYEVATAIVGTHLYLGSIGLHDHAERFLETALGELEASGREKKRRLPALFRVVGGPTLTFCLHTCALVAATLIMMHYGIRL